MTVTPLVVTRGDEYDIVTEGMGEEPTRYQVTSDPGKTFTISFPSIGLGKKLEKEAQKKSALDYDLAVMIVGEKLPPMDDCHAPTITRIIQDFFTASVPKER